MSAHGRNAEKGNQSLGRETLQRVVSALVVAPFVVLCFLSYYSIVGLVATIVMISAGEFFYTSLRRYGIWLVIMYTGLVSTYPVLLGTLFENKPLELLAFVYIAGIVATLWRVKNRDIVLEVYFAYTTALIYISFLLSFFIPMYKKHGADVTLLTLTLSWAYDSFAYGFGMSVGNHKLGSYYSPNKSWEGLAGGAFGAFLYAVLYQNLAQLAFRADMRMGALQLFLLACTMAIFGTFGDIFESSIKRHYGVKHMGSLMPGHGGMLDRIDGLLFAVPVVYYLVELWTI